MKHGLQSGCLQYVNMGPRFIGPIATTAQTTSLYICTLQPKTQTLSNIIKYKWKTLQYGDRFLEVIQMIQDAKMSNLEYCIVNINHQCWPLYKTKIPRIQPHLTTPMSLGFHRALTLLQTRSHKLGAKVAS